MTEQVKVETEDKGIELTYTLGAVTYVTTSEGVQAVFPAKMDHAQILVATMNLYQAISKNQQDRIAAQNAIKMNSLTEKAKGKGQLPHS